MSHTPLLPLSARQLLVSPDGLHLKLGPSALANVAQHGECPCRCSAPHYHHHHHHHLHFHHSTTPPASGPSGQVEQQNDLPSLAGPLSAQLIAAAAAAEEVDAATNDSAAAAKAAAAAATAAAAMSAAVAAPEALNESELPPELLAEALPLKTLLPDGTQLGAATGEQQLPKVMPIGDVGGR